MIDDKGQAPPKTNKRPASRLSRIVHLLTFLNMPIRRKFVFFSAGVSLWFLVLGGVALAFAPPGGIPAVLVAVGVAEALLLLFAFSITRSLTRPIDAMIEQIRALSQGDMETLGHITVASGDEVGELSVRFNGLLDALREMNAFKKVIESDDTAVDVYSRLARTFESTGLEHRVFDVDPSGAALRLLIPATDSAEWCGTEIQENGSLCRARKTGAVVSSVLYPEVCKRFTLEDHVHVCLPLIIGGSTGGVAQFVCTPRDEGSLREFRAKVAKAERYVKEALPVLEAKRLAERLKDSAMRDSLTGLYNRRFLEEYQATLVALAQRRNGTVGILLCDIDHFKAVNDEHGHAAGDAVLKEVAKIIGDGVRAADIVIRHGGEEFLVVLQETLPEGISVVAERIRKGVEQREFATGGVVLRKTISIGTAAFPGDNASFWECVKLADMALYDAKESGRNRVQCHRGNASAAAGPDAPDRSSGDAQLPPEIAK